MIEELNPKQNAKPKEPVKFEGGKNKVRLLRPFLIDETVVDKGDIAIVTDAHLKSHGHVFEKLAMLALLIGTLALFMRAAPASAQSYSANQDLASGPFYSAITNAVALGTGAQPATGNISGGAMLTNSVKASQYLSAVLSTPVGLTRYDEAAVMVTGNYITNTAGTLAGNGTTKLVLYPSDDGVNIDTNSPLATIVIPPTLNGGGFTNLLLVTNIARTTIGAHGYVAAGIDNSGSTNTTTNLLIQFFVKPQHSG